jgi:hypothetical protein
MEGSLKWIVGGLVGLIGLVGLFLAANAHDRGIHVFGLGLAAFAIIYVFAQMKQGFDARDRARSQESTMGTDDGAIIGKVTP